ncbi:MAG: RdgB/HAM1 family non-canonical purine NTP pyrophosphatase [Bacillales bacterium]|nr:RdgB/HAM1 family non-canonical purine NTP pyrophosphatase [Bacillales bacterium]
MKKIKIILASSNKGKVLEFSKALKDLKISFTLFDVEVEETGDTFQKNAYLKAMSVHKLFPNDYVLADDSGLTIPSLPDVLGVHSKRFKEELSYFEKHKIINEMLENKDRNAYFTTVLCLITPQNEVKYFKGVAKGYIIEPIYANGFGYDPIFFSNEAQKAFSSLSLKEKNKYSHRGKAIQKLYNYLLEFQNA